MKFFLLILFLGCGFNSVFSQTNRTQHVGWLFLIGDRAICFQSKTKMIPSAADFFKCKARSGGRQYAIAGSDQEEFKSGGKKIVIKMFYGLDTISIMPITFDIILNDDSRRSFKFATKDGFPNKEKWELFYKQKKYLIEFSKYDSSYIVNLSPEPTKRNVKR